MSPRRPSNSPCPPIVSEWPRLPRRTPDGPNKLYLGGFDPLHVESQMRQVAAAVGELKSFAWMPDDKGRNTGHAFMEYKDPRRTDVAVEALTGVSLGGTTRGRLVCRRACARARRNRRRRRTRRRIIFRLTPRRC